MYRICVSNEAPNVAIWYTIVVLAGQVKRQKQPYAQDVDKGITTNGKDMESDGLATRVE